MEYTYVCKGSYRRMKMPDPSESGRIRNHVQANTFEALLALNRAGERGALERMMVRLARYIRYTTVFAGQEGTLHDEIASVQDFLDLESLRFADRLRYTVSVAGDIVGVRICSAELLGRLERLLFSTLESSGKRYDVDVRVFPDCVRVYIASEHPSAAAALSCRGVCAEH